MGTVEVPKLLIWFFVVVLLVMLPLATRGAYQLLKKKGFLKVGSKTQKSITNIDDVRKQYKVQYRKRVRRDIRAIERKIRKAVKEGNNSIFIEEEQYSKDAVGFFRDMSFTVDSYTRTYINEFSGRTWEEDAYKISW